MRRPSFIVAFGLLAVLLGGCSSRYLTDDAIRVDVPGGVAVDVESFGGDVTIVADPAVATPRVLVVRESTHGYGRGDEGIESLALIDITTEVRPGAAGQVLRVAARTGHAEPHFQRAHLEIHLRDVEGVTVRTGRGDVTALGVRGAVEVTTGDGDIRVATELPVHEPVHLATRHGDVELRIRGESSGALDFRADGGRVIQRIRFGRTIIHPGTDHQTLRASYNRGENPIVLRARDGDITFSVVESPMDFGRPLF